MGSEVWLRRCGSLRDGCLADGVATVCPLLRLPSEALPIVRGGSGSADYGMKHKAVVSLVDDGLQLWLSHRKNISKECMLKRPC